MLWAVFWPLHKVNQTTTTQTHHRRAVSLIQDSGIHLLLVTMDTLLWAPMFIFWKTKINGLRGENKANYDQEKEQQDSHSSWPAHAMQPRIKFPVSQQFVPFSHVTRSTKILKTLSWIESETLACRFNSSKNNIPA